MGEDSFAAALTRADLLTDAGRHVEALETLAPALAAHPDDPRAHVMAAICHLGIDGQAKQALAHAVRAAALDPDSEQPYRLQALAHLRLGSEREALDLARRAVELAPNLWVTHYVLGHAALGDRYTHHLAVEAAQQALRLAPHEPEAHVLAARTHLHHGTRPKQEDREAAAEHLREALRLDPHHSGAVAELASVELAANRATNAVQGYLGALRLDPQSGAAVHGLSQAVVSWVWRAHLLLWLVGYLAVRPAVVTDGVEPDRGRVFALLLAVTALAAVVWVVIRLVQTSRGRVQAVLRATWQGDRLGALWAGLLLPVAVAFVVACLLPIEQARAVWIGAMALLGLGVVLSWLRFWPCRRS